MVDIRIAADPSDALKAAQAVGQAFDRMAEKIAKAGQAGKAFSSIDYGKGEAQALAAHEAEFRRMEARLNAMRNMAGATAQTIRNLEEGQGRRLNPVEVVQQARSTIKNPQQLASFVSNVGGRVLEGTSFDPVRATARGASGGPAGTALPEPPTSDTPAPRPTTTPLHEVREVRGAGVHTAHPPPEMTEPATARGPDLGPRRTLDDVLNAAASSSQSGLPVGKLDFSHPEMAPFKDNLPLVQRRHEGDARDRGRDGRRAPAPAGRLRGAGRKAELRRLRGLERPPGGAEGRRAGPRPRAGPEPARLGLRRPRPRRRAAVMGPLAAADRRGSIDALVWRRVPGRPAWPRFWWSARAPSA